MMEVGEYGLKDTQKGRKVKGRKGRHPSPLGHNGRTEAREVTELEKMKTLGARQRICRAGQTGAWHASDRICRARTES